MDQPQHHFQIGHLQEMTPLSTKTHTCLVWHMVGVLVVALKQSLDVQHDLYHILKKNQYIIDKYHNKCVQLENEQ